MLAMLFIAGSKLDKEYLKMKILKKQELFRVAMFFFVGQIKSKREISVENLTKIILKILKIAANRNKNSPWWLCSCQIKTKLVMFVEDLTHSTPSKFGYNLSSVFRRDNQNINTNDNNGCNVKTKYHMVFDHVS